MTRPVVHTGVEVDGDKICSRRHFVFCSIQSTPVLLRVPSSIQLNLLVGFSQFSVCAEFHNAEFRLIRYLANMIGLRGRRRRSILAC